MVSFCFFSDGKIKYTDRVKSGVTGEMMWLQINEPTPNDKGKYVLEMFDGKTTHTKDVDLSGQGKDHFMHISNYLVLYCIVPL